MRSLEQLGRSSEAKDCKKTRRVKCDRRTDGRTDRPTDKGVELLSVRLKTERATVGPLGLFFLLFPSLSILWPLLWSHSMQLYIPLPLVLQLVDWSVKVLLFLLFDVHPSASLSLGEGAWIGAKIDNFFCRHLSYHGLLSRKNFGYGDVV